MLQFPEEFFEGETREGFYIDETMKRVWAAQMEVLQDIIDICEKNNLSYYADWGTLLGAIRHKGWIPWDDDMDIALKRPDYQKLIEILKTEYAGEYWLMDSFMTSDYSEEMLRINNNAKIGYTERNKTKFHGCPFIVGLDIFPLDYIPRNPEERELVEGLMAILIGAIAAIRCMADDEAKEEEKKLADQELGRYVDAIEQGLNIELKRDNTLENRLCCLIHQLGMSYGEEDGDYLTHWFTYIGEGEKRKYLLKKEWYDSLCEVPFENMMISVPREYREVLNVLYGEWEKPARNTSSHDYPFYNKQLEELKKSLLKAEALNERIEQIKADRHKGEV